MRNSSILIGIVLAVIFFFVGYIFFNSIFMWYLPIVNNASYVSTAMNEQFIHSITFAAALALIPLAITITWKIMLISSVKQRILIALVILLFTFLAGLIRYFMIRSMALKMYEPGNKYQYGIPLSKVNIEIYMIAGCIIGSIVAYFLFRKKKNTVEEFSF